MCDRHESYGYDDVDVLACGACKTVRANIEAMQSRSLAGAEVALESPVHTYLSASGRAWAAAAAAAAKKGRVTRALNGLADLLSSGPTRTRLTLVDELILLLQQERREILQTLAQEQRATGVQYPEESP
jgi:hypothetical protein